MELDWDKRLNMERDYKATSFKEGAVERVGLLARILEEELARE